MDEKIKFRFAERKDVPLIFRFIWALAKYEGLTDEVAADEKALEYWLFDREKAEVIFAEKDGAAVGFALFFHNFSTFLGRAGIYLEDLYVLSEYRKLGVGKALMRKLAGLCIERGCGRLEWSCLNWNAPSISFYLSIGARPMKDWTGYRLSGDTLSALAGAEKS